MKLERISQEKANELFNSGQTGMMGIQSCHKTDRDKMVVSLALGDNGEYHNFIIDNEEGFFIKVGLLQVVEFTKWNELIESIESKYGYNMNKLPFGFLLQ
ncbi:hypothetical protein M5X17_27830 [Paenibacillus alvei]|uniref:hypothetical protein n=1 Tax=Paenibacillus alvei TaxID=44250 RepID=UPI00227EF6B1|nr:hypothetical protein [Paenibacillus alvei]MCY9737517.1 hypothetical protein [Paenibacillus alvei]